jgi:large subunit ribosomal protein L23
MGIFNKKTSTKTEEDKKPVEKSSDKKSEKVALDTNIHAGTVIKNPRITEKAAYASDKNVYTFDVAPNATKIMVERAVKEIYKVSPVKVNISAIPTKKVYRRDHGGVKGGGKKAYVFLKKGDKIEFV